MKTETMVCLVLASIGISFYTTRGNIANDRKARKAFDQYTEDLCKLAQTYPVHVELKKIDNQIIK